MPDLVGMATNIISPGLASLWAPLCIDNHPEEIGCSDSCKHRYAIEECELVSILEECLVDHHVECRGKNYHSEGGIADAFERSELFGVHELEQRHSEKSYG